MTTSDAGMLNNDQPGVDNQVPHGHHLDHL